MQLDQSENLFTDYMQGYLHLRLSNYILQYFSDGWWRRECLINVCSVIVEKIYSQRPICNPLEYYCIACEISTNNYQDYRNKILWFLFPRKTGQERKLLFYLHAVRYVGPLLLYCTKLMYMYFFVQLTKGALFFQAGGIIWLMETRNSNISWLFIPKIRSTGPH